MGLWNSSLLPKQRSHKERGLGQLSLPLALLNTGLVVAPSHPDMNNSGAERSSYFDEDVNTKWDVSRATTVGRGRYILLFFFSLSAVMWSAPQPSTQTKLVIGFGCVPFLLCFGSTGWIVNGGRDAPPTSPAFPAFLNRSDLYQWAFGAFSFYFLQCWSNEGMIPLKWWSTSWETEGV